MDIASDRDDTKVNRPGASLGLIQAVRGMVSRLLGCFALTEIERLKVGICLGGMQQDR